MPCGVRDNLERAHWEKLVWNVPFNGLGVAGAAGPDVLNHLYSIAGDSPLRPLPALLPCLPTDQLLGHPRWAQLVRELMLEVMYDLPSRRDIKFFTVTRDLVEQRSRAKVLPIGSIAEVDSQASA